VRQSAAACLVVLGSWTKERRWRRIRSV